MTATETRHLGHLAEASFLRRGDYPALLFEGRWHTSGELFARSCRLGAGLAAVGVKPGDRVVVTMANCPEVGVAYQALWRAGAVVTPATFLLPAGELRHVVADAEACAVITTPEFVDKVRMAVEDLDCVRHVICTDAGADGLLALGELEQADPGPIAPRSDDDLAALLYTGGTTGQAKGVMLSHANLHFSGRSAHDAAHVPGVNRALATLPLSHAYGLLVTIAGLHSAESGIAVLLRWFDPEAFLSLIGEHRLQLSATVPSMLQILLSLPLEEYDLSSLRYLSSGGAPLAPEVETELRRRVPSVSIRQGYGLTETAALISTNPAGRERRGSVGQPVPGTEVRIVDEHGSVVDDGEAGEICCRSPGVMRGYWRSPEATEEALSGGWLHTGDIGYRDEEGYLFILDRKKDLIIRGGFNVYPRDVEDALLEHPDVQMAGVVGTPSVIHGEEVVAFVASRPGSDLAAHALIDWARERIGGYKYPREVHIVEAIPLTPVGKTDRKALRSRLAEVVDTEAPARDTGVDAAPGTEPSPAGGDPQSGLR
ncbi:MAG: AMP-binding protein [Actinomycetota bacterium]|nr:AMP-binding protein [Actinomycetota bacterium]